MNPVPRTAMAFVLASFLSATTYPMRSSWLITVVVVIACSLVAVAIGANAREIKAEGRSIGFTQGRTLPIAGLNFATFFTMLAVLIAVCHGLSQSNIG